MYDIFLSYSTKDRERLQPLVSALEARGWTVFWDHRSIKVSEDWHDVISAAIQQSKCVIVAWSVDSVTSQWVKEQLSIRLDLKPVNPTSSPQPKKAVPKVEFQPLPFKPTESTSVFYGVKLLGGLGILVAVGVGGYQLLPVEQTDTVAISPETRLPYEPIMREIPAGKFVMGCDDKKEKGCQDDEKPPRTVSISKFLLAKTEVTVAQFRAFVEAKNYKTTAEKKGSCYSLDEKGKLSGKGNSWKKLGFEQGDDHSVACVSHDDAKAYVSWLSDKTGKKWRLPSEAEWEYAARAGIQIPYYWDESAEKGCKFANMADKKAKTVFSNWSVADCDDGYVYTAPVGRFKANSLGLFDMYGNVWEWVEDKWHNSYEGAPTNGRAWISGDSSNRVLRGGSWLDTPQNLRSAPRNFSAPGSRLNFFGFRPAQDYK